MAKHQSAIEVKKEHINILGKDLGHVFHAIYIDYAWLHIKWEQYVELYGKNPERVKMLNKAAGLFFKVIQTSLWDDVLLHLARLTEAPGKGKKQRLTFKRLPILIEDDTIRKEIEKLVEQVVNSTEFARDWRNRRIAHRSLHLAISEKASSLTPVSRKKVKQALKDLTKIIQKMYEYYFNSTIQFGMLPEPNGAESLIYVIKEGIKVEEERLHRIRTRKMLPEDFKPRDVI